MSWNTTCDRAMDVRTSFSGNDFEEYTYSPEYQGSNQFGISFVDRDISEYPKGIIWDEFEPMYYPKWHILRGYKEQMKKMWTFQKLQGDKDIGED